MSSFKKFIIVNSVAKSIDAALQMWDTDTGNIDLTANQSILERTGRLADSVENENIIKYYYHSVDDVCYAKSDMTPTYPSVDQALVFDGYVDVVVSGLPSEYEVKKHSGMVLQTENAVDLVYRLSAVGDYLLSIVAPEYNIFKIPITVVDNRGDNVEITNDDVKAKRDQLEEEPITVTVDSVSRTFYADLHNLTRMSEQLRRFDLLPTLASSELTWELSDGTTIDMTKVELQSAYDDIRDEKADRRANLFDTARTIMALSPPTLADIADDQW